VPLPQQLLGARRPADLLASELAADVAASRVHGERCRASPWQKRGGSGCGGGMVRGANPSTARSSRHSPHSQTLPLRERGPQPPKPSKGQHLEPHRHETRGAHLRTFSEIPVTTVSATEARRRLYALIDEVGQSHQPVQIHGKRGNAVLLSEDDWRSIQETLHLLAISGMRESILEGMATEASELSTEPGW